MRLTTLLTATSAAVMLATGAFAQVSSSSFHLDRLPVGKAVTIPKPATTLVPLTERVTLTATDMPQSVSFRAVNTAQGPAAPVRLAIYDSTSDRVQYVDVQPGTPFVYTYKELMSITVVPQTSASTPRHLTLQVESNKPLEIAR